MFLRIVMSESIGCFASYSTAKLSKYMLANNKKQQLNFMYKISMTGWNGLISEVVLLSGSIKWYTSS